jgi:nucleotide-binding universal stress UspA family protein
MANIAHTTDFSDESAFAFQHALRLALCAPARLDLLHVRGHDQKTSWENFPHVRQVLSAWGVLGAGVAPSQIESRLGLRVTKVEIGDDDPLHGIERYFARHEPDLAVVATHGRQGLNRWLNGSVSEDMATRTHVPTLMIGPKSRPFVDPATGELSLKRVLLPVAATPSPRVGLYRLGIVLDRLALPADIVAASVGGEVSDLKDAEGRDYPVSVLEGPVVEAILSAADKWGIDLIAMPTAGRHGVVDALRGSTTSQVVSRAPCPVLALPAVSS